MELLARLVDGTIKTTMARRQLPMILPAEKSVTLDGPFREVMEFASAFEQAREVLSVSVFYVQPWLDLSDVGCSVVVVTNDNQALADEIAEQIADEFWRRRTECMIQLTPLTEAVQRAIDAPRGPVILADGADAPSGGAAGDSPAILRALLEAQAQVTTLINIVDPPAVERAVQAGIGEAVTVQVGGAVTALWSPIEVRGTVRLISDGVLKFRDAGYQGIEFHRGRTVVLQSGSIYLQMMELPVFQGDTALYTSVGLDPRDAHIVVVKTPTAFRVGYEPFAAGIILVDSPGITSSNLQSFDWQHLSHPYYPFDDITDWRL
jgi:microcystin degradation protein MlrC